MITDSSYRLVAVAGGFSMSGSRQLIRAWIAIVRRKIKLIFVDVRRKFELNVNPLHVA